jgi:hypothetical protein
VFQDNPHLSADGKTLWFSSNRSMGLGGRDIWSSSNSNGSWSAPVNVGAPVNTAADDDQFWFSAASPDLYWNHPGEIMRCPSAGSTCSGAPEVLTIPGCKFPDKPSITDDGRTMYFACRVPETGGIKIMYSIKQESGSWGVAALVD